MRLLNRHTLVVRRKAAEDGHYNENGRWVSSSALVEVKIKGNLQPYIKGSVMNGTQLILPDGVRLTDTKILYTVARLRTSDDQEWEESDTVVYDGHEYEVFMRMDWENQLPHTSHNEYIIIRRDKMNEYRNTPH